MKKIGIFLIALLMSVGVAAADTIPDGYTIVKQAFSMWRGQESASSTMTMTITRPDRTESMTLQSWSMGDTKSVAKFVAPAKYKGQAILVIGDSMWTYSPKSRRSIKIASSLKSKPWMGSDMSYDDIAVSLESLSQYTYTVVSGTKDNTPVYIITAIPFKDAPIVWGKEIYYIRKSDNAMLAKEFFDQAGNMIRRFDAIEIGFYNNDKTKPIMKHMRVTNLEKEGWFTDFIIENTQFNIPLSDDIFSLANLERP
ncbi:MAG: outer membrane lipoprotein-sorting protein [Alphaproteobacteria bacterium]|jgi:outer membrane lipoprotein-sorting protein|nr:outer membrane lipoprotein-sorting protein [Alphaproteobacteria bacterium]